MKTLLLTTLLALATAAAQAQAASDSAWTAASDTLPARETQDEPPATRKRKRKGLVERLVGYFAESNKERPDKKFDFSVIGGPHYSTDTKLGLGLVATGLYRADRSDPTLTRSNVALYGDVTTGHFYKIGVRGNHIFPRERCRVTYDLAFDSFKSDFWGIGYERGNDDANESDMKRCQVKAQVAALWRVAPHLYAGPALAYDFVDARDVERPELLDGMPRASWNAGLGLCVTYDSRDVLTNPHQGLYASLSQYFRPAFLGSGRSFYTTDLQASAYLRPWRDAVLAMGFLGELNFGHPSWGMMARLGGSYSMRGYYEGRYRDKHKMEAQVELRQHVWRRNSVVAWAGVGTVFGQFSDLRPRRLLPNFGVGYRWEFKKDVNVRLDYGFGKSGQSGFIFNLNEAF